MSAAADAGFPEILYGLLAEGWHVSNIMQWEKKGGFTPPGRWRIVLYHFRRHPTIFGMGWGDTLTEALAQALSDYERMVTLHGRPRPALAPLTLSDLDL